MDRRCELGLKAVTNYTRIEVNLHLSDVEASLKLFISICKVLQNAAGVIFLFFVFKEIYFCPHYESKLKR